MDGRPLDIPAISKRTGSLLSVYTLRDWAHQGRGPHWFKLGGRWVALDTDVERWLQEEYESGGRPHDATAA